MTDLCERCHEPLGDRENCETGLCADCSYDDASECSVCGEDLESCEWPLPPDEPVCFKCLHDAWENAVELNEATIAWVEREYHHKVHSELHCTPLERYLQGSDVGRPCSDTAALRHAFCTRVKRRQRKSDGTFSLDGQRYEVPSPYRHLEVLHVQYARWDLSHVTLVDPHSNAILSTLYPQDK